MSRSGQHTAIAYTDDLKIVDVYIGPTAGAAIDRAKRWGDVNVAPGPTISACLGYGLFRTLVVRALARQFRTLGHNQSALARSLGVPASTVRKWLRSDPELRAALYAEGTK